MDINNYGSRGVANAGLITGVIGSTLGAINSGILPNILGGWNNGMGNGCNNGCNNGWNAVPVCSENMAVNRYELAQQKELVNKDMEIAYLRGREAAKADSLELYKYFDAKQNEVNAVLASQAVQNQATKDSFQLLQERLECCKNEMLGALARERDERKCGDTAIVNYLNATFYPKLVSDVTVGTTTTAQTVYNPLPVASCGC